MDSFFKNAEHQKLVRSKFYSSMKILKFESEVTMDNFLKGNALPKRENLMKLCEHFKFNKNEINEAYNVCREKLNSKDLIKRRNILLKDISNCPAKNEVKSILEKILDDDALRFVPKFFEITYENSKIDVFDLWKDLLPGLSQGDISSRKIKKLFEWLLKKYKLHPGWLGHYIRELDPLSKWFNGDVNQRRLNEFTQVLIVWYLDSLILKNKWSLFKVNFEKFHNSLSPGHIFRYTSYWFKRYNEIPSINAIAYGAIGRVESSIKDVPSITGIVPLNQYAYEVLRSEGLDLSSQGLTVIVRKIIKRILRDNPKLFTEAFRDKSWRIFYKFSPQSSLGHAAGLFNFNGWGDGNRLFPKNVKLPLYTYTSGFGRTTGSGHCFYHLISLTDLRYKISEYIKLSLGIEESEEKTPYKWVTEYSIYLRVKKVLRSGVIHQWIPSWAKPYRYDVAIPKLKIVIEYHGRQHFEPIDFFGGAKALKEVKRRDRRKRYLAKKNGFTLLEFKYDQHIEEIYEVITNIIRR